MDTTNPTTLHPLHALYLNQNHGEVATLVLRARLAGGRAADASGPAAIARAAARPLPGLGLVAAVPAAYLGGQPTGEQ